MNIKNECEKFIYWSPYKPQQNAIKNPIQKVKTDELRNQNQRAKRVLIFELELARQLA